MAMKVLRAIFVFSAAISMTLAIVATALNSESGENEDRALSVRGMKRFFGEQYMTCDEYPSVCRSAGHECCKKKCVNVKTDRLNCGMCGYKCKYTEICCNAKCVNASFDKRHCGQCHNKCNKGEYCTYGMCSYA